MANQQHDRIKVRCYDYKKFAGQVGVTKVDGPPAGFESENRSKTIFEVRQVMKFPSIIFSLLLLLPISAGAQNSVETCATNSSAPPAGSFYWPPDSDVQVYLRRKMFTPNQRGTLFKAMQIWTSTAQSTGAGVRFTYAGETAGLVNCRGCLTISRREVYKNDREHYAFFHPMRHDEHRLLFSAWIVFDFATTSPHALQAFMVHELGHGLGLWDCQTCKQKKTIMNSFPGINRANGLVGPSTCDLQVVKEVYALHRRVPNIFANAGSSQGR